MGGLFAATAHEDIVPLVMDGLAGLAPHACNSSGVGVLTERRIQRRRIDGPVSSLDALLSEVPIVAPTALGHTGRATLGLASRRNAQPHASSRVALVQTGIFENHGSIRLELEREGAQFRSDTDSEVIVWLLDRELASGAHPITALQAVLPRLRGSFALGMICSRYQDRVYAARRGAPLAVGQSSGKAWLASDADVLGRYAPESMALEDGQIAELRPGQVRVFDAALARQAPRWVRSGRQSSTRMKTGSGQADLVRDDIALQPTFVARALRMLTRDVGSGDLERWCGPLWQADRILAIGCGDSYHAAHVARAWFEQIAGIPVELELSWELAVRRGIFDRGTVPLVVSSPETDADALAALRHLKRRNVPTVALAHGSSGAVAQEADFALNRMQPDLDAAPAVAFLPQLTSLAAASVAARHLRDGSGMGDGLPPAIADVPRAMEAALALEALCAELGRRIADAGRVLLVGRGAGRPLAALAARRLETLSQCRADVINGGELKYRSRWSIRAGTPAVVLSPDGGSVGEALSDARHVIAGGGEPWLIGSTSAAIAGPREELRSISVDGVDPLWAPFVFSILLQLIACHAARAAESSLESTQPLSEPDNKAATPQAE